ncbi:MAG: TIGR04282 family arsenosugar biosynthesis glycosyltransferase [Almyronema sp.]
MAADHLIVFTRYPTPGQTKTRLISALGEMGAADLQRQMTEHTLKQVQACQRMRSLTVEICFTGATQTAMQAWLGSQWCYRLQGAGDLGDRLLRAFERAAKTGCRRTVAIGIDCPGLNANCLNQAFEQLGDRDLVLGPATDGGYYLIGLQQPQPTLFKAISWGTSAVLSQTVAAATQAALSIAYLEVLQDVDYPQDLAVWEAVHSGRS